VSPDFGIGMDSRELVEGFLDYFANLRNSSVKLDGYTIEYLILECYEHMFGIVDLSDEREPLAAIRYTNADTLGDLSSVSELIKQYRTSEIYDKYGLNIRDYFDMPINISKLLISNAQVEKQDLDDIVDSADKQANREWKKRKNK
jgi:hypothetical protein